MRVIINIVAALAMIIGGWAITAPSLWWARLLLIVGGTLILIWELYSLAVGKRWIPAPKIALTKATLID